MYSTRTLFQSAPSSSVTIIAMPVVAPLPISVFVVRIVTVLSGAIETMPVNSEPFV